MLNFIDPAILFFIFGFFSGSLRSNLEIPIPVSKFLSLYLLMSLGLKGGFALSQTEFDKNVVLSLGIAIFMSIFIPLITYCLLKKIINHFDAAALAASYGSVSAVTFITATQYLDQLNIAHGHHMIATFTLMESPAIILAILFTNQIRQKEKNVKQVKKVNFKKLLYLSFTDGTQLLLLGSMIIGLITGNLGEKIMEPFIVGLFKGILSFFLLDMGITAAKNFSDITNQSFLLILYGFFAPIFHAILALFFCYILTLPLGETVLLMVLAASASYIAVPAVVRESIPEANPSLYFGMALGLTFPLNIILGIPMYLYIAQQIIQ